MCLIADNNQARKLLAKFLSVLFSRDLLARNQWMTTILGLKLQTQGRVKPFSKYLLFQIQ